MHWILAGALSLLVAGCDMGPAGDTLVVSSDPRLAAVARELLPDVAERAGLELREPVKIERRSREHLVRYLTTKLDEELSAGEEDLIRRSYALLGLVPVDLDLRALFLAVYTEQVAGFYDPDSTALFVLDDEPASALRTVLVHELVHALQDQAVDLDSLTAKERGNDRRTAAQAAVEGHATLVMLEYMMEAIRGERVDLSVVNDLTRELRPALDAMRAQYPALAGAPLVVQESLLFPYIEGAAFVQRLWQEAPGRPAPFGPFLPRSTAEILQPGLLLGSEPADLFVVELEPEARTLYSDDLGQLETGILLESLGGHEGTRSAASGWRGDRYALVETGSGDALVWVVVWEDHASRDRYLSLLSPLVDRLPRLAGVQAFDLDGAPALALRVGDVGPVGMRAEALARRPAPESQP